MRLLEEILRVLAEIRPDVDFAAAGNFIDEGLIDSFDIVALVSALEESFGILIDGLEIVPENFESMEAIASLVKKSGGSL